MHDGGYGLIGNIATYLVINSLKEEDKKEFINKLKKDDETQYNEYLEFVEMLNNTE